MNESTSVTRRDFLVTAGAGLTTAVLLRPISAAAAEAKPPATFVPVKIPDWVRSVTRMAFVTPGEIDHAAELGVQVCHGNAVWPYFPLRRDGGGLSPADRKLMKEIVERCHRQGMKYCLGLPPFPSVACVKAHPEWRTRPDLTDASLKVEPLEDNLGTRLGCNNGPWGDYLIDVCVELVEDFGIDGYSFDGNYHPSICYCAACQASYQQDRGQPLPSRVNLDDIPYREYLAWRGERLEQHYSRLQQRLKAQNPDAVVMSWTVNAGRYGHYLHSPRAMPTRMNQLFDLPMQEWWLDETNFGASVAPAFGAAYSRAVAGDRPAASEAYLMSRGNPYGTDSFPKHERITRSLLGLTNGSVSAESLGWPGHQASIQSVFDEIKLREKSIIGASPLPWAAMLVSEQTRQFYAYRDIADRFLPHVFGTFRVAIEEHFPLTLINDWDIADSTGAAALTNFKVLILPAAAALSDQQVMAIREFVRAGGGLVATGESSLCDELGRPRPDFALADLFGVSYRGRPAAPNQRETLDANFAITVDEAYWRQRVGAATLTWTDSSVWDDPTLKELVPSRSATFKGPQVLVTEPQDSEVIARMVPAGSTQPAIPAVIARTFGAGRVAYLPAGLDAAMWSYSYPYQRRMLTRLIQWAAGDGAFPIRIEAPKCVQTTFWSRRGPSGTQTIIHFFNGLNTTANHGLPAVDVPLREETVPIHGIKVHLGKGPNRQLFVEPGHQVPKMVDDDGRVIELLPLEIHQMLILD
ncbi:MAG: hypothetical protein JSS49_18100 [Planctomycetes bacterium]|nr:hypothetical protein [Planctomycetota bacterium]